jgi:exopolysaccharide biosynthesis polyprenyl glycosylphosphotransferase
MVHVGSSPSAKGSSSPQGDAQQLPDSRWARRYAQQMMALDSAAIAVSMSLALLLRVGDVSSSVAGAPTSPATSYIVVATLLGVTWLASLILHRSYEAQFLSLGGEEYRRIGLASARLWGCVAVVCYVGDVSLGRSFVAVAFPLGVLLLFVSHWSSRKWLKRVRHRTGGWSQNVLVLGDRPHAEHLISRFQRSAELAYRPVGVCLPSLQSESHVLGVPVVGTLDKIAASLLLTGADTVAVTASPDISPPFLRQLSWDLEQMAVEMVVAPALTDVAGPRIHVRPVDGLPLLHVTQPEFTGPRRIIKSAFDRGVAAVALLVLSPFLLGIALAIRLTSNGPAIFTQQRVGQNGGTFRCYKYRTMVVDAENRLSALLAETGQDAVLFKLKRDPRITSIGGFLRRLSIDELPQLLNVLRGQMSLVGPRPQVPAEVERYTPDYRRRLLVKPGITGLWQVSGRSDLSLEDSVRLDLYYVENWSLANDMAIIWRTVRAVVASTGAY